MTPVSKLSKIFWGFQGSMCLYGITRGFRIDYRIDSKDMPLLFTDRVVSALMSGYFYGVPLINLIYLKNLSDRIEIHARGLNRELYKDSYKEVIGVCDRTL